MQDRNKTVPVRRRLLARRWVRSAALVVIVAAGALGASALLSEDEADAPGPRAQPNVVAAAAPPAAKRPTAPRYGPPKPTQATDPVAARRPERAPAKRPEPAPRPVPKGDPDERVRALRELELRDPAAAARTAAGLVRDPVELVRLNAVAVLTRSSAPEAARALAALDPESKRLADALKGRK